MAKITQLGLAFIFIGILAVLFGALLYPSPSVVDSCTVATCESLYAARDLAIIVFGVAAGFVGIGLMFAFAGLTQDEQTSALAE